MLTRENVNKYFKQTSQFITNFFFSDNLKILPTIIAVLLITIITLLICFVTGVYNPPEN